MGTGEFRAAWPPAPAVLRVLPPAPAMLRVLPPVRLQDLLVYALVSLIDAGTLGLCMVRGTHPRGGRRGVAPA